MPFLSLGRGFADEFMVSDFAAAAYHGELETVRQMLAKDPSVLKDDMALYLSLRGGHREIFSLLIQSGILENQSLDSDSRKKILELFSRFQ